MKNLLLTTLFLAGLITTCHAYQANDTSKTVLSDGSYSDTSQAVGYALGKNQGGWVVTVGAAGGTYVWTSGLVVGANYPITIQGASPTSRPTIIFNTTAYSGIFAGSASQVITIKDFIFNIGANRPSGSLVGIGGSGVCFRVTNCKFLNASQSNFGMTVGSINSDSTPGPFGLVDHCQFFFPGGVVYNYVQVRANGNVNGYGWTQPMSWGTVNSVVVEDCAFSQPSAVPISGLIEADGAARLTVRYNTITNIPESTHGLNSGAHLSTLQVECYENHWILNDTNNTMSYLYLQRGGTGVVWSNTVSTTSYWNCSSVFVFWVEAASSEWQAEWFPSQAIYPQNYPATQQIGQGVLNGSAGLVPTYVWGNNTPATQWGNFVLGMNSDGPFIKQGRDIYTNSPMPGYTALVYPHPLVASGGTSPGSFPTNSTGNSAIIPPTDLQAHPPAGQ
ncbi:MAG TPA: hypothetical protein VH251_09415 [Verrucomicrobiae bacterium]|nr:hypothetical protein [Verrucomicrobiae bacterium]